MLKVFEFNFERGNRLTTNLSPCREVNFRSDELLMVKERMNSVTCLRNET